MARIGQRRDALLAALGVACALPIALWMRGFEIDDALISIRYARHLADGVGYRFNAGGPSTDGVTPLPWPFVLAPLARHADAWAVLDRAKVVSLVAWLAAAARWGIAVGRAEAHVAVKVAAFALLAACVPVGAHAVSGMETGLATALATFAVLASSPWTACALAGLAASLRPEMAAWAMVLAIGVGPIARAVPRALVAIAPFVACAAIRFVAFGRVAPLALMAKPSDVDHGLVYAGAAALVSLAPIVACAPLAYAKKWGRHVRRSAAAWSTPDRGEAIAVAGVVHFAVIVAVGGDWMPFARLAAPIAPSLLYAFVVASPRASRVLTALRVAIALAVAGFVLAVPARRGRDVEDHMRDLAARAKPWLAGAHRIAALDVGWPTTVSDADVIDLAGLTDPEIAALPGGHTSKRVDLAMLLARRPDVVLLYRPRRLVEIRLEADLRAKFVDRVFLAYGDEGAGYDVYVPR